MILFHITESFFKLDYYSIKYIGLNFSYFTKFEINLAIIMRAKIYQTGQN